MLCFTVGLFERPKELRDGLIRWSTTSSPSTSAFTKYGPTQRPAFFAAPLAILRGGGGRAGGAAAPSVDAGDREQRLAGLRQPGGCAAGRFWDLSPCIRPLKPPRFRVLDRTTGLRRLAELFQRLALPVSGCGSCWRVARGPPPRCCCCGTGRLLRCGGSSALPCGTPS